MKTASHSKVEYFLKPEYSTLELDADFIVELKSNTFWLNRGFKVYLDLYAPNFPKSDHKYLFGPSTFFAKNTLFWWRFDPKKHPNNV